MATWQLGDPVQAIPLLEAGLAIHRATGNRPLENLSLMTLGIVQRAVGNRALAIQRMLGDRHSEAYALTNLGELYADWGDFPQAIAFHTQAITLMEALGDQHALADFYGNFGETYVKAGDYAQAVVYWQRRVAYDRAVGHSALPQHCARLAEVRGLANAGCVPDLSGL